MIKTKEKSRRKSKGLSLAYKVLTSAISTIFASFAKETVKVTFASWTVSTKKAKNAIRALFTAKAEKAMFIFINNVN